jgi:flavin reductase (DIM6/NTAB) family NADH-FMN oxidoreductase RutF
LTADPFRPLKDAFGRFATGVALIGCRTRAGGSLFVTVNSFTSVSLSPPLVLWCLERRASSYEEFMAAPAYSVAILRADQQALSERFARHAPAPIESDQVELWETGAPILKDRLAAFDCRITDRHGAGDHVVLIAQVERFEAGVGLPLLYFASRYAVGPETKR